MTVAKVPKNYCGAMFLAIVLRDDPYPSNAEINDLWASAWSDNAPRAHSSVLSRSLAHVGAFDGQRLIGFVNVAWDGGFHAFILDTTVHPDWRRQGIATRLVGRAERLARGRGAHWLHVDFEPNLADFYRACGFAPTDAGLIRLRK